MPSGNSIYTHTQMDVQTNTEEMKWPNNVENISHTFYVLITMIVITTSYSIYIYREREQLIQDENSGTKELHIAQRR